MILTTDLQEDSADESKYLVECQERGYDIRVVPYEDIHSIRPMDFDALARAVDPQDGETILDAGAGYGAVTREILIRNPRLLLRFCNLDVSGVQLERGIAELVKQFGMSFVKDRICF